MKEIRGSKRWLAANERKKAQRADGSARRHVPKTRKEVNRMISRQGGMKGIRGTL